MNNEREIQRQKMKARVTGFYWCNIGVMRGYPSGWTICHWDNAFFCWKLPIYNSTGRDDEMVEIDERKIERVSPIEYLCRERLSKTIRDIAYYGCIISFLVKDENNMRISYVFNSDEPHLQDLPNSMFTEENEHKLCDLMTYTFHKHIRP